MYAIIDLDDVLLNFHAALLSYAHETLGIEMDMKNHKSYSFFEMYGMTVGDFLNHVSTQDFLSRCKPFDNAKSAMDKLSHYGCKPVIVTARGYMENANEFVEGFLSEHSINVHEIIVSAEGISKSFYYQKLGRIDLIVDDGFHNIMDASRSKIVDNLFLVNKPWNSLYDHTLANSQRVDCIEHAVNIYINR